MEAAQQAKEATETDLGWLLDESDDAVVTLVAGETRLVAHRAVLSDRSPVFGAMFQHQTLEASSGAVTISDVEGPLLRQLVAYLYNLQAPQVPGTAHKLLAAADKYGLSGLKEACEQQVLAQLSVETAAAAAVLAIRHGCASLRTAAIHFIKSHLVDVMATRGYADAVRTRPEDVVEMGRLLSEMRRPASADSGTSATFPGAAPASAAPPTAAAHHGSPSEISAIETTHRAKESTVWDLGSLLDAGDGAVVVLEAGETRLAAHRAVLAPRSPVFAAMFAHDTREASSGVVAIPDVEGAVLRLLLAFCYSLQAPQVPDAAPQLLAAADKYGLSALKEACERQLAARLSVQTAAAAAVLAVRHSCTSLKEAAVAFVRRHAFAVMATRGWADAVRTQPEDVVEISRLLSENGAAPPAASGTCPLPSGRSRTPATSRPTAPPDDATVSCLRRLSAEEKGRRLREAAKQGAVGELEALLAAGADVAARDSEWWDWTELHWAARNGHEEAARRLLAAGAAVDARDSWQETPLHDAARNGHAAVVRLLLDSGASHSARQSYGWTPLHLAACSGHTQAAAALLEAGAERAARDNEGKTPLDEARSNNHQQVLELLDGS